MTNYNDGFWHGWNGGQCPVHPETVVDVALDNGALVKGESANKWFWDTDNTCIIAFRVIKEHKEPREFWLVGGQYHLSKKGAVSDAKSFGFPEGEIIHVLEVIE